MAEIRNPWWITAEWAAEVAEAALLLAEVAVLVV
jgi:hypothetical protein